MFNRSYKSSPWKRERERERCATYAHTFRHTCHADCRDRTESLYPDGDTAHIGRETRYAQLPLLPKNERKSKIENTHTHAPALSIAMTENGSFIPIERSTVAVVALFFTVVAVIAARILNSELAQNIDRERKGEEEERGRERRNTPTHPPTRPSTQRERRRERREGEDTNTQTHTHWERNTHTRAHTHTHLRCRLPR